MPGEQAVTPIAYTFRSEVERLRAIEIAKGNFPEVMNPEEAALFVRRSVSFLMRSDAPRSPLPGRGKTGKMQDVVFLKSQLVAWVANYLTYDATETERQRTPRKRSMARAS